MEQSMEQMIAAAKLRLALMTHDERKTIQKGIKYVLRHDERVSGNWIAAADVLPLLRFVNRPEYGQFNSIWLHAAVLAANERQHCIEVFHHYAPSDPSRLEGFSYRALLNVHGRQRSQHNERHPRRQVSKCMAQFLRHGKRYAKVDVMDVLEHLHVECGLSYCSKQMILEIVHMDPCRFSCSFDGTVIYAWGHGRQRASSREHPRVPLDSVCLQRMLQTSLP